MILENMDIPVNMYFQNNTDHLATTIQAICDTMNACKENIIRLSSFVEPFVYTEIDKLKRDVYKVLYDLKYVDMSENEFLSLLEGDD